VPLYEFECQVCGKSHERVFKIVGCPTSQRCDCGGDARKVIVPGHGGIKTDNDVPWLKSAVKVLQPDHERPIETRGEYNRYLKENNVIAAG
jgi:putative FmdB family regulatory protein